MAESATSRTGGPRVRMRAGEPDLYALPWDLPLREWPDRIPASEMPRGLHRNVVEFVRVDDAGVYVVKELPDDLAVHEYEHLRRLRASGVPAVEEAAVVTGRVDDAGRPMHGAVVTRHLPFAMPYRVLLGDLTDWPDLLVLRDALVELLVQLHLAGFLWGDCSLSNVLYQRDALGLAAHLVDAETVRRHPRLSDGQRGHDLEIARLNIAGGLMDLGAAGALDDRVDPIRFVDEIVETYEELMAELTRDVPLDATVGAGPGIDHRLRELNDLGFDVTEVELTPDPDEPARVRMRTIIGAAGRHERILAARTGIVTTERLARRMLQDIDDFAQWYRDNRDLDLTDEARAALWHELAYRPAIDVVPDEARGVRDDAQVFFEILGHRGTMPPGTDNVAAARSWCRDVRGVEPLDRRGRDGGEGRSRLVIL